MIKHIFFSVKMNPRDNFSFLLKNISNGFRFFLCMCGLNTITYSNNRGMPKYYLFVYTARYSAMLCPCKLSSLIAGIRNRRTWYVVFGFMIRHKCFGFSPCCFHSHGIWLLKLALKKFNISN